MARLIDADLFLKSEIKRCKCVPLVGSGDRDFESLKVLLEQAPVVEAEEIRYGKWIFDADYSFEYVCTECRGHVGNRTNYAYCPHCGAYMRDKKYHNVPF